MFGGGKTLAITPFACIDFPSSPDGESALRHNGLHTRHSASFLEHTTPLPEFVVSFNRVVPDLFVASFLPLNSTCQGEVMDSLMPFLFLSVTNLGGSPQLSVFYK